MNTITTTDTVNNISIPSRIARMAVGFSLIVFTLLSEQTPLGFMSILPLLAIYPVFTGMVGWDPLKYICNEHCFTRYTLHLNTVTRSILGLIGTVMMSSVFMVSGAPGLLILLPLLAVYPIYTAILGEEPVTALFNLNSYQYDAKTDSRHENVDFLEPTQQVTENYDKERHHDLAA